jgi:hypothetical protein
MVGKLWDDFISAPMDHFRNAWIRSLVWIHGWPWSQALRSLDFVDKIPSYLPYGLPITFS